MTNGCMKIGQKVKKIVDFLEMVWKACRLASAFLIFHSEFFILYFFQKKKGPLA